MASEYVFRIRPAPDFDIVPINPFSYLVIIYCTTTLAYINAVSVNHKKEYVLLMAFVTVDHKIGIEWIPY